MTELQTNPESDRSISVVGRENIYARLQQHVLDPPHRHALVFTGHDGIGKTALLRHFPNLFDNQILGVYMSLADVPLASAEDWLDYLLSRTNDVLAEHDFTIERVSQEVSADMTYADWFQDVYLYEVIRMIRPQRRIVWLFDDFEYLLDALPEQVAYLYRLLQTHLQLAIVIALDTEYENRIHELIPLASEANTERLHRLSLPMSMDLIRLYAPGASDEIVNTVYEATGGHPRLLANYGYELNKSWASNSDNEALQVARSAAYAASDKHFRYLWQSRTQNERLVLTAIASLIYDNPLQAVTVDRVEAWLVETDYPLDTTAIHAALRALEYQDIVSSQRQAGFKLVAGMMQLWLLENARLDDTRNAGNLSFQMPVSRRVIVGVMIVIIILTLLLFIFPAPTLGPSDDVIPTVTLAQ